MELILFMAIAAVVMHAWETARDEHRHVRDGNRRQLRADNPDRSDSWVNRHGFLRSLGWWGHEAAHGFPAIRAGYREDLDHIRLLRERGELGRYRRARDLRQELERARQDRIDEAVRDRAAAGDAQHQPAGGEVTHCDPALGASGAGSAGPAPGQPQPQAQVPPQDAAQPAPQPQPAPAAGQPPVAASPGAPGEGDPYGLGLVLDDTPVPGEPGEPGEADRAASGEYQHVEPGEQAAPADRNGSAGAPTSEEGDGMTTGTTNGAPTTGEAPSYDAAKANASGWIDGTRQMLNGLEHHQVDVATQGDLAQDPAVMGPLDQALDHFRNGVDAMQLHLNGLAAHQPGQEYADSVAKPANTDWLKSQ